VANRQQAELAAEVMGVSLDGLTSKLLGAAYKEQIRIHHPDAGGEHEDFIRLQQAKGVLVKWLDGSSGLFSGSSSGHGPASSSPSHGGCSVCGDKGYVTVTRGFTTVRRQCNCMINKGG